MQQRTQGLVRAISKWSLAALMLNGVVGSSIYGLPSLLAARLGALSPLGYIVTALGTAAVAACLAEVGSQFRETGGPYLYARTAFGPFAAIQIGWLTLLARIFGGAAASNLFVSYLAQFFPVVESPTVRVAVLVAIVAIPAAANYIGVATGTRLSDFFTVTKIFILLLFVAVGFSVLWSFPGLRVAPPVVHPTRGDWLESVLLMVNAFAGFESALFLSGESRNPRKDPPFALLIAIATATILYASVQYIVVHTLPSGATASKPVADVARHLVGPVGASAIAVGILVTIYGYLGANMLTTPRLIFAMGEHGDIPSFFARIHPRFRTPHVSIISVALLITIFAIIANFRWNTMLSAVSRLFVYASIAAALPVLRKKQPAVDAFRLRGAMFFVAVVLLLTGILASSIQRSAVIALAVMFTVASASWFWRTFVRRDKEEPARHEAAIVSTQPSSAAD